MLKTIKCAESGLINHLNRHVIVKAVLMVSLHSIWMDLYCNTFAGVAGGAASVLVPFSSPILIGFWQWSLGRTDPRYTLTLGLL